MISKKLTAMVIAAALTVNSISCFAGEAPQKEPGMGAVAASAVSNLFRIPGKFGICVTSVAFWPVLMIGSAGMLYKDAGEFVYDCCTGKWYVTPSDMDDINKSEP